MPYVVLLEKARKKPYGHPAFTRRTTRGKLAQVRAKGVKPIIRVLHHGPGRLTLQWGGTIYEYRPALGFQIEILNRLLRRGHRARIRKYLDHYADLLPQHPEVKE